MPTLTIKNLPDDLYVQLKRRAERNRRSLNSEVIVCLEYALHSHPLAPEAYVARARQLREKTAHYLITDDAFNAAKREGRP